MQATIDMEIETKVMELKKERDVLGRRHMDRDNALRKVRKATQALDTSENQIPPLKASLHAANVDMAALNKEKAKTAASAVELKKDTDILINSFLKEEKKVRTVEACVVYTGGSCHSCVFEEDALLYQCPNSVGCCALTVNALSELQHRPMC